MINKIVIVALLASLAVAHGAKLSSFPNANIASLEKNGKLLEVPTIGELILKGLKIGLFLLKSAWSLVGLKLAAVALAANVAIWALKNFISVAIGAVAMFGFCKLTGKCSLDYVPKQFIEIGDNLVYAARQLENGASLYEDNAL